jgi:hypothetical protein
LLRSNNSTQPQADSATHSVQTSKHSAIGIIGSVTSEYQNQLADLNSSFFDVEEANNVNDSMHEDQAAQSPSKTNVVSTQPGFNPDSEAYVWKSLSALPQNVSNSSLATLNTVNSHVPGSSKRPLSNQRGGGHAAGGNLFPYNNVIIAKPPPIGPTARVLLKRGFHQLFYDVSNVRRVGTLGLWCCMYAVNHSLLVLFPILDSWSIYRHHLVQHQQWRLQPTYESLCALVLLRQHCYGRLAHFWYSRTEKDFLQRKVRLQRHSFFYMFELD